MRLPTSSWAASGTFVLGQRFGLSLSLVPARGAPLPPLGAVPIGRQPLAASRRGRPPSLGARVFGRGSRVARPEARSPLGRGRGRPALQRLAGLPGPGRPRPGRARAAASALRSAEGRATSTGRRRRGRGLRRSPGGGPVDARARVARYHLAKSRASLDAVVVLGPSPGLPADRGALLSLRPPPRPHRACAPRGQPGGTGSSPGVALPGRGCASLRARGARNREAKDFVALRGPPGRGLGPCSGSSRHRLFLGRRDVPGDWACSASRPRRWSSWLSLSPFSRAWASRPGSGFRARSRSSASPAPRSWPLAFSSSAMPGSRGYNPGWVRGGMAVLPLELLRGSARAGA